VASTKDWQRVTSYFAREDADRELFHPRLRDRVPEVVERVWEARRKETITEMHKSAMEVVEQWQRARQHQPTIAESAARYRKYADWWYVDTQVQSSIQDKVLHPAYLRIIGMGDAAIPFILRDLRDRPAQWFVALASIADTDPVRPGDSFSAAVEKWLRWGRKQGYQID